MDQQLAELNKLKEKIEYLELINFNHDTQLTTAQENELVHLKNEFYKIQKELNDNSPLLNYAQEQNLENLQNRDMYKKGGRKRKHKSRRYKSRTRKSRKSRKSRKY